MTLHVPIKLFLKSSSFSPLSFSLVSGQDLQVPGGDRRDSMSSTPNRLYKDAKQKENNVLCAFICLWKKKRRGGGQRTAGRWRKKRVEQHKVNKLVFLDVEFSENEEQRGGQNRKRHFPFTLSGYRRSRPASLFHQEKMLIINLGPLPTSLFNG